MSHKLVFLTVFWLAGGCSLLDDPYNDPEFRAKHTQLKFCVNEAGAQAEPEFRVMLNSWTEEITLQKGTDGWYCGRPKRLVLFPSSSSFSLVLEPLNNAATLLSSIEVRYPVLSEEGKLVATSTRIRRSAKGAFLATLLMPYEHADVVIAPRMIPDDQTNEFF